ncbi:MAG: MBL fold metallo-hydrolase [Ruminococcaceae bacterium]|nr:MBL fold metallo-hydrolase [Oscillospiraceae bacterium]
MAKKRRRKNKSLKLIITVIVVLAAIIAGAFGINEIQKKSVQSGSQVADGEAMIHFIDVGQGDAILITMSEGNVLIDAGTNSSEDELKTYLDSLKITEIEYAVFTHPHEDHIGGADMVLENYDVNNILIPDYTYTSATYNRMIDCIEKENAKLHLAKPDMTFKVDDMEFFVLAPISQNPKETNNSSVVIKAAYGSTTFMFTGDAEAASEEEIMARYTKESLKCDLLKVGHHGSDTSTSNEFLSSVAPKYAVMQVGVGNPYDHPCQSTLLKLEKAGVEYYRTDLHGDIVFVTDGKTLTKKD